MKSQLIMIRKLIRAINTRGYKLLLNQSQVWMNRGGKDAVCTKYVLRRSLFDEETQKYKNIDIFSTFSQIQLVLFLRDFWFTENGMEIPTDNEVWENIKKEKGINYAEIVGKQEL